MGGEKTPKCTEEMSLDMPLSNSRLSPPKTVDKKEYLAYHFRVRTRRLSPNAHTHARTHSSVPEKNKHPAKDGAHIVNGRTIDRQEEGQHNNN